MSRDIFKLKIRKMKKIILVFIALFTLIGFNNSYATPSPSNGSYNQSGAYYIEFMHNSNSYGLCFFNTGGCRHWTPKNKYNCREGRYYVQNGTIYITWNNGQQETLQLKYDSNGRAYIYYKGKTYYDGYTSNN